MAAPLVKLDHCVIKVSNFDRSDAFYARVLGCTVEAPMPQFRFYRLGAQQLNVHGPELDAPAHLLARIPVAPGNSDLCFEWPGPLDGAVRHLAECGVPIETGPIDTAGAKGRGHSVYFRDPDGSLLEFITYTEAAT